MKNMVGKSNRYTTKAWYEFKMIGEFINSYDYKWKWVYGERTSCCRLRDVLAIEQENRRFKRKERHIRP